MALGWIYLVAAGAFEVGFTTAMRFTGRGQWVAETAFVICIIVSFLLLQQATKTVPIGIAYAVWTGIGAAGTLVLSLLIFKEPINRIQIAFLVLLILSVAGLKFFATKPQLV